MPQCYISSTLWELFSSPWSCMFDSVCWSSSPTHGIWAVPGVRGSTVLALRMMEVLIGSILLLGGTVEYSAGRRIASLVAHFHFCLDNWITFFVLKSKLINISRQWAKITMEHNIALKCIYSVVPQLSKMFSYYGNPFCFICCMF